MVWLPMAEHLHLSPADLDAMTVEEFDAAVDYLTRFDKALEYLRQRTEGRWLRRG